MVTTRNSKGYMTPQKPKRSEEDEQSAHRMATRSQFKVKVEPSTTVPSASQTPPKTSNRPHKVDDKVHYEFGGPLGAFGVIFGLPIVIYGLYFLCNDRVCVNNPLTFDWKSWIAGLPSVEKLFSWEATTIYLGWMAFHVLMERYSSSLIYGFKSFYLLPTFLSILYVLACYSTGFYLGLVWRALFCPMVRNFPMSCPDICSFGSP